MFVSSNKYEKVKSYFYNCINDSYSKYEIDYFWKESIKYRFDFDNTKFLLEKDNLLFSESDLIYIKQIKDRLNKNEPFQYIIGKINFFELEFNIDSRALIPRPETEELVRLVTSIYPDNSAKLKILDLGTGSGCIALSLKSFYKNSNVTAIDIDDITLSLAIENSNKLGLEVEFIKLNFFENNYPFVNNSFDVWISNPPYIPYNEIDTLEDRVKLFEPHQALFTPENDAMCFYNKIISMSKMYLKDEGMIFFESHEKYAELLKSLLEKEGFMNVLIKSDLQDKNRMLFGTLKIK